MKFLTRYKIPLLISGIAALVLVAGTVFYISSRESSLASRGVVGRVSPPQPEEMKGGILFSSPTLTVERKEGISSRYVNESFAYSFELFHGFAATEADTDLMKGGAVLVENKLENGFLVLMSVLGSDIPELTRERILQDVPGMYLANETPVSVVGVRGLCFDSSDKLWDGSARECWFVLKGVLYQFSTKREDGALLTYTLASFKEEPGIVRSSR